MERLQEHRLHCDACQRPITVLIEPATLSEMHAPARAHRWPCPHCGFVLEWMLKATVRDVCAGDTSPIRCRSCGQDMPVVRDLDTRHPAGALAASGHHVPLPLPSTYHRCPTHGIVRVFISGQQQVLGNVVV